VISWNLGGVWSGKDWLLGRGPWKEELLSPLPVWDGSLESGEMSGFVSLQIQKIDSERGGGGRKGDFGRDLQTGMTNVISKLVIGEEDWRNNPFWHSTGFMGNGWELAEELLMEENLKRAKGIFFMRKAGDAKRGEGKSSGSTLLGIRGETPMPGPEKEDLRGRQTT